MVMPSHDFIETLNSTAAAALDSHDVDLATRVLEQIDDALDTPRRNFSQLKPTAVTLCRFLYDEYSRRADAFRDSGNAEGEENERVLADIYGSLAEDAAYR